MSVRKKVAALIAGLLLAVGVSVAIATPASAASGTISGTVTCYYGNDAEVGVWVDATSGTDGWASYSPNASGGIDYSYTLSQSSSYELHIGCGGTSTGWGKTFYTYPDQSVSGQYYDWVCGYETGVGYMCYST